MSVTVRGIQRALHAYLSSHEYALPNYTPNGWFECDYYSVTKAGYAHEYEIKLTRSDFRADAKKGSKGHYRVKDGRYMRDERTKHELLAAGIDDAPKHFYFVVPTDLVALDEVPDFAGLIYAEKVHGRTMLREQKRAPILSRTKVSESVVRQMARNASFRYWRLWLAEEYHNLPNKLDRLHDKLWAARYGSVEEKQGQIDKALATLQSIRRESE